LWQGRPTRWIHSWPGRWYCCYGGCLTTPCTWNTRGSVLAPTPRWRGRFPSIGIGRSSGANARSTPTVSGTPPILPIPPTQPFDADILEYHFPTTVAAKLAIANELGVPLIKLAPDDRAFIDHVLGETRMRRLVLQRIRDYFRVKPSGADHAG